MISDLEGDLLARIQDADPGAATPLYTRFAAGVRALIRHKLPNADTETGVFHVLVTVARAVRLGEVHNPEQLVSRVREVANAFIAETSIGQRTEYHDQESELRRMVREVDPYEREILNRFYHLAQTEKEISSAMKIPPETVREVRRRLRRRFQAQK